MIKSSEELKSYWDSYSETYVINCEVSTTGIFHNMIPLCRLKQDSKVLEVSCGSGNGLEILRNYLPSSITIYGSDISPKMIEKAQEKNLVNVHLTVADNENLPYSENFCDRYIASLSLNIVPNPETMLKEAFRVLVPGGIAVFSVLGREEPTNLSTLVSKSCKTLGLVSNYRSIFYLNNDQNLRTLLKSAGFINVLTFYTSSCFPLTSIESALNVAKEMSAVREIKNSSYEKYAQLEGLLIEKISEVFNNGQLFTFDALIAVGEKII
ncbi:hypothetical protein SteCoe_10937 [Stentor coeruleus]|uniref:Methyltransferase type 11 domain-containing protein n=1 Tax=Stentor coeruleus TaxID=5963 RepID=A0A1R2CEB1_9CILI|nr:hypothetical protein SteCoe_10937 [Stentor coeruleus]